MANVQKQKKGWNSVQALSPQGFPGLTLAGPWQTFGQAILLDGLSADELKDEGVTKMAIFAYLTNWQPRVVPNPDDKGSDLERVINNPVQANGTFDYQVYFPSENRWLGANFGVGKGQEDLQRFFVKTGNEVPQEDPEEPKTIIGPKGEQVSLTACVFYAVLYK